MSSASGASLGSSQNQNCRSDEDLQHVMDQRKRKRMISNRESARRSRMRKQRQLDDLVAQLSQLRNDNDHVHTSIGITTQLLLNVEAENSVLRARMAELTHRLRSLDEIIHSWLSASPNDGFLEANDQDALFISGSDDFLGPWNLHRVNQPIMASVDLLMY